VLYATRPTPEQQGVGFGVRFEWDVSLTEGYRCHVVRAPRPDDSVHSSNFWGLNVPEIAPAIRETRPQVALIPGWHSVTLLRALWACRRSGVPVLYRGDTQLGSTRSGWPRLLRNIRTRLLLGLFDGYLSVGSQAHTYLRHFGVSESRIFGSPHCVDNEFFAGSAAPHQRPHGRAAVRASLGLDGHDFVVLFVGKLEPKKRPLDLIRAMARIGPGTSLLMVGTGGLEAACRAEAERLGVRVTWAGFLNQSELGRVYAAADCLALVSDGSESWGLVVNEALATGLPCVVSDYVGCGPDLITPGETGEVFQMGEVAALCAALERVRERARRGHDWAPACRARAAAYSFDRATSGLLEACRAVVRSGQCFAAREAQPGFPRIVACCGGMVIVSGLERMTFEVLRVLRERGAAVHCIVSTWENHRIVALAEQVGASWSTGHYWYRLDRHTRNPLLWARRVRDVIRTSLGLMLDARKFRTTHVLVPEHTTTLRNALGLVFLRLAGIRVVAHVLNAPAPGTFYRRLWRWALHPLVDSFVCCSRNTQQQLVDHGVPEGKTRVIYNIVPNRHGWEATDGLRDPRLIVSVGQIIPEKGVDLLLDAVGLLIARGRDARLAVVGQMDGWVPPAHVGYRQRLLSRASAPDLARRVQFLGWREDVPALLLSAGIHCCPSRPEMLEGLPLICLEAKLAGLPSVAFRVGPFPEIIQHGKDGWLCEEVSAAALANGLEYFLADPARRECGGRAARASMERFSRERFADAWWSVFTAGHTRTHER
jgi:glycosyltransferase involved in cell wall biosynthesis